MKTKILIFLFVFGIKAVIAQTGFEAKNLAADIKHKSGEVIVKFKDDIKLKFTKSNNLVKTGFVAVDNTFEKWSVGSTNQLFRNARFERNISTIRFPDGKEKSVPQFHNIFLLKFPEEFDPELVVRDLNNLEEVEYAEVNGTAYIHGLIPVSEPLMPDQLENNHNNRGSNGLIPNDPLYNQQWYLPEVKADVLWETVTGDTTEVIAILDTGVDWTHPDLINKIWQNPNETINGQDTDGNGFVDDIRGWDFVNDDNNPMDDNSHGTHCAGIAAAETNNGIGISGVSWGARIMPVKVFQSNGVGYFSHIAEGFWYAAQNGATIFSNSWSSTGESITIRLAMEYAYSKGLIVAAAGNQNSKTDFPFPPWPPTEPNFPACYNWVLGVEATLPDGSNTWFSNFDPTGPIISDGRPYGSIFYNNNEYNYEMRAPGLSFISTIPGGQYRIYSGTSMACPLVAGSIALMRSYNPNLSNEEVFSKLIQPIKINPLQAGVLDIQKCTFTDPPADLYYVSHSIADSLYGGNNNGRPNAGETIEIYVNVKNAGGLSDSVFVQLRFAEFEDTTTLQILDNQCKIGFISAYGTNTSFTPLKVKLNSNLVNNRIISLELLIWEKRSSDIVTKDISLTVEHGIEISGTYDYLHLSGDAYYLVTDIAAIDTLIIDPGVTLRFNNNSYILIGNFIQAIGTPDSMITFKGAEGSFVHSISITNSAYSNFEYCIFEDGAPIGNAYLVRPDRIYNSIFRYNNNKSLFSPVDGGDYQYNLFYENGYEHDDMIAYWELANFKNNIIAENIPGIYVSVIRFYGHHLPYPEVMDFFVNNVFVNNYKYAVGIASLNGWEQGFYKLKENYWGTTNIDEIRSTIYDFYENNELSVLEPDTILYSPPDECHGIVWKVLINEENPQDGNLDPIGAGPVKFDVYFNRPMDVAVDPFVTFGVRPPYTQNFVSESASWSADSTIWTAYHTMSLSSGDGINTVRVANAKDTDHFEIPIERSRFKFIVQVAGSQSIDFFATPGIGKVTLEWPASEETDILGYNLYRFQMMNGEVSGDTIMLNSHLVTDTIFNDFAVIPDETYYYMFTQMKTDFTESDYSKVVSATPFSTANGDANGDMIVNLLDITTIVSYILNQNPQPFLFDAADVNFDGQINLLDIIGVLNIIMNSKASGFDSQPAYAFLESDKILFQSDGSLSGFQFQLRGPDIEHLVVKPALDGFELIQWMHGDTLECILFSLTNQLIPSGKLPLLYLENSSTELDWGILFASNFLGEYVPVHRDLTSLAEDYRYEFKVYPNPANGQLTLDIYSPEDSRIELGIYDHIGRKVYEQILSNQIKGSGSVAIDLRNRIQAAGIYFLTIHYKPLKSSSKTIYRKVEKLILEPDMVY